MLIQSTLIIILLRLLCQASWLSALRVNKEAASCIVSDSRQSLFGMSTLSIALFCVSL